MLLLGGFSFAHYHQYNLLLYWHNSCCLTWLTPLVVSVNTYNILCLFLQTALADSFRLRPFAH